MGPGIWACICTRSSLAPSGRMRARCCSPTPVIRSERWHQCLQFACPEMEGLLGLHHSAVDRSEREAVEAAVKNGLVRRVVCTSPLNLGVGFQPVQTVVQIGSPKKPGPAAPARRPLRPPAWGHLTAAVHADQCPGTARGQRGASHWLGRGLGGGADASVRTTHWMCFCNTSPPLPVAQGIPARAHPGDGPALLELPESQSG